MNECMNKFVTSRKSAGKIAPVYTV